MPTVYDCLADEPIKDCETMGEAVELQKMKGGENKCFYVFTSPVKCDKIKESVGERGIELSLF
ncbi:MAG: hypothetical protein BWY95_02580 [Bacteroidetes bacterium ADurb.BinA104]|nr:MAG: hypothetical protein BWY95_02580 [Bacteroidetes bacterium ADurb.BinA104]